jgi:phenylalanyl-tRNA synthetase beta chain
MLDAAGGGGGSGDDESGADGSAGATSEATSHYVTLRNPASPERAVMRRSILTGLLDAAADNLRFRERIALFEVGSVFHPIEGQILPDEPRRAGLLLMGPVAVRSWRTAGGGADGDGELALGFYDAKGAVEALLSALGVEATFAAGEHAALHPGRTAAIHAGADDVLVGHVGELHPLVRERWELGEQPVAVAELDLDALAAVGGVVRPFVGFSSYPAVERDLAVVVDETTPAGEVEREIRVAGGPLLVMCELFDVYRGEQLDAGKKSLAFSLRFQAPNKTLQGKAVDGMRGRIVKALERAVGAEIR